MAMAFTLVINSGSSSVRYAVYTKEQAVFFAHFWKENNTYNGEINGTTQKIQEHDYANSLLFLKNSLAHYAITAIGLRIVAPGSFFTQDREITPYYCEQLRTAYTIAPLHISGMLSLIEQLILRWLNNSLAAVKTAISLAPTSRALFIPRSLGTSAE